MGLYVFSGITGSGKTSLLWNACKRQTGWGGFLSPLKEGKRNFFMISNKEFWPMEADAIEGECIEVGRYVFCKSAFDQAIYTLNRDWSNGLKLCIFDEYGPLEFRGTGLMPALEPVLHDASRSTIQHLLVVVRSSLLNNFLEKYRVDETFDLQTILVFLEKWKT